MENDRHAIFVYGTFRRHMANAAFRKNASAAAEQCFTRGVLYDTGEGYPVLVQGGEERAYGELIEVSSRELEAIDELEGYSAKRERNDYSRKILQVETDTGEVEAMAYVYDAGQTQGMKRVRHNDWKCHLYLQKKELLYFAYGSCMDEKRFIEHQADHHFKTVIGRGLAEGYDLAFTRRAADGGRADMIETGGTVEGKVYKIKKEALEYLFEREGVLGSVYRPAFLDIEVNGERIEDVLTFLVIDKEEEISPPQGYWNEIICGAEGCVSEEYLERLMSFPFHNEENS